jgi:hypothetical protein
MELLAFKIPLALSVTSISVQIIIFVSIYCPATCVK